MGLLEGFEGLMIFMTHNRNIVLSGDHDTDRDQSGTLTVTRRKSEVKEPSMYQVLLHNDDFTPMDFVVDIIEKIFHLDRTEATKIMLDVHHKGTGICGIYPFDIADTKVALVAQLAKENEYPLRCTLQKA